MFDNPELFKKYGRTYEIDEIMFCEYEKGEKLYYIVSGKVCVSKITKNSEKVLVYLEDNEFVGEMAIFENKPRTATITAVEQTKVLVFSKDEFFNLIKVAPQLVVQLIKVLTNRYINTESQLNSLLQDDIEKRIINYIYEVYIMEKRKGIAKRITIDIEELVSVINAKKQDVIAELMIYQKKKYLSLNPTSIVITQFVWLQKRFD